MDNNRQLNISVGSSRKSTQWKSVGISWAEFVDKLKTPIRGTETLAEYMAMKKPQQDELKDVGGFVGGSLLGERRKANAVIGRDLVTLDLDSIPEGQTLNILKRVDGLGCAALVYSTRKHAEYAPRLRVVIPLDRTVTADEYEPIARKLGYMIGISFCDPTTFEAVRLMYWASCCADSTYIYEVYDKPFCSADGILKTYNNWTDVTEWPVVPGADAIERRRLAKAENPLEKKGLIGAFCREYDIFQAIEKFIPGMYEPTAIDNRLTFVGGSTTGGAIVYDAGKFLYSHHATDPCSGLLVNSFDLIRLHKFGHLDDEAPDNAKGAGLPSFVEMKKFVLEDEVISQKIAKERIDKAMEAFAVSGQPQTEEDTEWTDKLARSDSGAFKKTINNIVVILQNDTRLKGKIVTDIFACRGLVMGTLPWNSESDVRPWEDSDISGINWYLETFYDITGRDKITDAINIVAGQNAINEVKDYLIAEEWDGVKRLDTLLIDYLGAEDNPYTRAVMRKTLVAAVARAIIGGVKFDTMPILTGPQGIGKSTFLSLLGNKWFTDSLTTFEGKDAAEIIQGSLIVEVGELTAMSKQESNSVKQFLSKCDDKYRAAYGRTTSVYPRRCVFIGTSNDEEFLKDTTGNRRFWPVDVGVNPATKNVFKDLPGEVHQIWAEAYAAWQMGEELFISGEVLDLAMKSQDDHRERSDKEGYIEEFLKMKIPYNWYSLPLQSQRMIYQGLCNVSEDELVERDRVCATEILQVCFNMDPGRIQRRDSVEINGILKAIKDWKPSKTPYKYGFFGSQRGFTKATTNCTTK
ncbi:MAG: virulence-associated E family protein [Clostridiales bacterium]|nr:virulence-associated E family protein [Clostridiales bacterium]MDU1041576.1 virulence-associated E family protein [Clostridiales bacterium]